MANKSSPSDRLNEYISRKPPTVALLTLYRNMGFGAGALCLVLLLGIGQMKSESTAALTVSAFSASFALPLWVLLGITYEFYKVLGERSYEHLGTSFFRTFVLLIAMFGGLGLAGATGGIIYHLEPGAIWSFGASLLIASFGQVWFHSRLARWWFAPEGPGSSHSGPSAP